MTTQDVERLQREIAKTRDDLSQTVQALAIKADVPSRARERVELLRTQAEVRARVLVLQARDTAELGRRRAAALLATAGEAVPPDALRKALPVAAGATGAGVAAAAVVEAARRRRRRLR